MNEATLRPQVSICEYGVQFRCVAQDYDFRIITPTVFEKCRELVRQRKQVLERDTS